MDAFDALAAAREREEWFRALAEAMPQIVCALRPDGTPEYVNPQWIAYSGLDLAATARLGWQGVLHPDDQAAALACLHRAAESGTPNDVELRYRAADGSYRWFLSRLAPIRGADGRIVRWIGAAMDIEDRRRAEAERELLVEALQRQDRHKDEFLAVLSHELRNPLAPIRNALYLLGRSPPGSPPAARAREVIERQVQQLTRLVADLLDSTRISSGKVVLAREVVDLARLVHAACEDHRPLFEQQGLELRVEEAPGAALVDADATRLAQVVGNLLQNAAKFTPPGGRVTVAVEVRGGEAEVRVRDTGVGMAPDLVPHVFEAWVQATPGARERPQGGLGLGLSLVKALVEQHGGSVSARSDGPGRGAEVAFRLPAVGDAAGVVPAGSAADARARG